jgi:hypothetical protein
MRPRLAPLGPARAGAATRPRGAGRVHAALKHSPLPAARSPPLPPHTDWTRLVPRPVLNWHVSSRPPPPC